jgi:nucleoside-diphosphate-sugar epimerase
MKSNSILFVGCGDLGCRSGLIMQARGWQVAGLRRDPSRLPAGFTGIRGDYSSPGDTGFIAELKPDYVVATFNPSDMSVEGYQRGFSQAAQSLLAGLGDHRPRAILSVSSTRVYAERDGGWVDETSPLSADDPRALAIIAAEQILLGSVHRVSVVRFAGIYGYPGGRLLERIRRGELSPKEPLRFSNRIHRDDCAGFLCHLLGRAELSMDLHARRPLTHALDKVLYDLVVDVRLEQRQSHLAQRSIHVSLAEHAALAEFIENVL